ncbi:ABC-F family ATP-binding cassette domain-containing protein, partial [Candidatus Parcubacteria bacterium]|nr:ABC-F family ATP-binding cassette domain-containing protein [Candidatus Parcubacteria bacterium]
ISHDADFLNCFTEGVIYLDIYTHKIEQYVGDYYSVVEEIERRIEKERRENARLKKEIQDSKEKMNFFAHKGGKMRKLAKKMRDDIAQAEDDMVDVRRDDKTIKKFEIPAQDIAGKLIEVSKVMIMKDNELVSKEFDIIIRKGMHMLVTGPNGIGKSTFLRSLIDGSNKDAKIMEEVRIGYYSQDFASLDFNQTVYESLNDAVSYQITEPEMRALAAGFLIYGELIGRKIGELSDGQKGLLSFARLVLMRPGVIILDEPTNHINFRHLPVIAEALDKYKGAMILVSHMSEFVEKITIDEYLRLEKI